ncbi:hypothetical protein QJQ45_023669 [Haematococcus lacustris]|nr:hypothetical protein QJQ45_023669 [Haematococcus lacustris]
MHSAGRCGPGLAPPHRDPQFRHPQPSSLPGPKSMPRPLRSTQIHPIRPGEAAGRPAPPEPPAAGAADAGSGAAGGG